MTVGFLAIAVVQFHDLSDSGSAMAVIEGMKLERQLRFALPPFVHFQQEKLVDESEWLLWSK